MSRDILARATSKPARELYRQQVLPKRPYLSTRFDAVISEKTAVSTHRRENPRTPSVGASLPCQSTKRSRALRPGNSSSVFQYSISGTFFAVNSIPKRRYSLHLRGAGEGCCVYRCPKRVALRYITSHFPAMHILVMGAICKHKEGWPCICVLMFPSLLYSHQFLYFMLSCRADWRSGNALPFHPFIRGTGHHN
jgi:hypothetical protein